MAANAAAAAARSTDFGRLMRQRGNNKRSHKSNSDSSKADNADNAGNVAAEETTMPTTMDTAKG